MGRDTKKRKRRPTLGEENLALREQVAQLEGRVRGAEYDASSAKMRAEMAQRDLGKLLAERNDVAARCIEQQVYIEELQRELMMASGPGGALERAKSRIAQHKSWQRKPGE